MCTFKIGNFFYSIFIFISFFFRSVQTGPSYQLYANYILCNIASISSCKVSGSRECVVMFTLSNWSSQPEIKQLVCRAAGVRLDTLRQSEGLDSGRNDLVSQFTIHITHYISCVSVSSSCHPPLRPPLGTSASLTSTHSNATQQNYLNLGK